MVHINNTKHIAIVNNQSSNTLQQTSSPDIIPVSNTLYNRISWGQLSTHYHLTTYPSSPQSAYDMTIDCNKTDEHSQITRKQTGHNSQKTQSPLSLRPPYPPTYTLPIESSQTSF